jgi:hypothetical protein
MQPSTAGGSTLPNVPSSVAVGWIMMGTVSAAGLLLAKQPMRGSFIGVPRAALIQAMATRLTTRRTMTLRHIFGLSRS